MLALPINMRLRNRSSIESRPFAFLSAVSTHSRRNCFVVASMTREQIREYLEFYKDLGFETIYRASLPAVVQTSAPLPVEVRESPAVLPPVITDLPPLSPE